MPLDKTVGALHNVNRAEQNHFDQLTFSTKLIQFMKNNPVTFRAIPLTNLPAVELTRTQCCQLQFQYIESHEGIRRFNRLVLR